MTDQPQLPDAGLAPAFTETQHTPLDVRGLVCPLPVLRANKLLRTLAVGDVIEVLATDPAAPADFQRFCETTGHILIESRSEDGEFALVIRKTR